MSRYDRQLSLPEVGAAGQARLAGARVLVVGAGGLGSALLPLLAGAGVGQIRIIDPDVVEESNLHRQVLYRMSDIGQPKARIAAAALSALNPDCAVQALVGRLDPEVARRELPGTDLVIDAADSFATTYALSDACLAADLPLVTASVLGRSGYVGGFCGGAPGYRAVFPDLPEQAATCASAGVMGPAVATLGALQAQMALSVLLRHAPSPLGQLLTLDLASWRVSGFRFEGAADPEALPLVLSVHDLTADDLVIDLREAAERPGLVTPRALRLAPEKVPGLSPAPGQRTVFVCTTGLRAWRAARAMASAGHGKVAILADP